MCRCVGTHTQIVTCGCVKTWPGWLGRDNTGFRRWVGDHFRVSESQQYGMVDPCFGYPGGRFDEPLRHVLAHEVSRQVLEGLVKWNPDCWVINNNGGGPDSD